MVPFFIAVSNQLINLSLTKSTQRYMNIKEISDQEVKIASVYKAGIIVIF